MIYWLYIDLWYVSCYITRQYRFLIHECYAAIWGVCFCRFSKQCYVLPSGILTIARNIFRSSSWIRYLQTLLLSLTCWEGRKGTYSLCAVRYYEKERDTAFESYFNFWYKITYINHKYHISCTFRYRVKSKSLLRCTIKWMYPNQKSTFGFRASVFNEVVYYQTTFGRLQD